MEEVKILGNGKLIKDITKACDKAIKDVQRAMLELRELKTFLNGCRFLNLDIKEEAIKCYEEKISRLGEDIADFTRRIEELGGF